MISHIYDKHGTKLATVGTRTKQTYRRNSWCYDFQFFVMAWTSKFLVPSKFRGDSDQTQVGRTWEPGASTVAPWQSPLNGRAV